jgi:hypothetical protein
MYHFPSLLKELVLSVVHANDHKEIVTNIYKVIYPEAIVVPSSPRTPLARQRTDEEKKITADKTKNTKTIKKRNETFEGILSNLMVSGGLARSKAIKDFIAPFKIQYEKAVKVSSILIIN